MELTEVKIRKVFTEGRMKALVSITLEDLLVIHDIKVIEGNERLFVAMPSRKESDGSYRDIVHPISSEFRAKLENNILEHYHDFLKEQDNIEDS